MLLCVFFLVGFLLGGLIIGGSIYLIQSRLHAERARTLTEQMRLLAADFTTQSVAQLVQREESLSAHNKEQIQLLFAPLAQRLEDFRRAAEESKKTNGTLGLQIETFFKNIKTTSESFSLQAKSFVDALTGANKKQGNWGEAILGEVLVRCGLQEGQHFFRQKGSNRLVPDYQVLDPSTKRILVVDAKMSWTNYEEAYRLPAGEARREALRNHVASVRRHIDELVKTDYPSHLESPLPGYSYVPLTALFLPCEAALAAALENDPTLVDYAYAHHIALVSPLTLFGFLQLVSRGWSRYEIDHNSEVIYAEAKKLVTYVDRLFRYLEDLGDILTKAQEKHQAALRLASLDAEGQCLKGPALKILKLGGTPDRALKSQALTTDTSNASSV